MPSNAAIRAKNIVINIFKYALLIFSAFVALVPIVSLVNTAFKTEEEYANTNVMTLPENWLNFDNFITAWNQADMGHAFINSFIILVCVLAGSVMISSMLAYVLNRFKFPGNGLIRNAFMIATLIPGIAAQVTVYQIMTSLHLVNSMPGYIILMMGTDVITIYIFLQFFENLSVSLDESAILDGANWLQRTFYLTIPSIRPIIAPAVIITVFTTFKQFDVIYLLTQQAGAKTGSNLHTILTYAYENAFITNNYGYSSAVSIIIFVVLIAFSLLTRQRAKEG